VARDLKTHEEATNRVVRQQPAPEPPSAVFQGRAIAEIVSAAQECRDVLDDLLQADQVAAAQSGKALEASELVRDIVDQARAAQVQLGEALDVPSDRTIEGVQLAFE
jgi:hypothetical protein